MRYEPNLISRILEELRNTPNIRYVCKKIGIHRSTFHRWMGRHHEFYKAVQAALDFGRDGIIDAAEAVFISGIQNGDFKCAKYYVEKHSPRYASPERNKYLHEMNQNLEKVLREPAPVNFDDAAFDGLFGIYFAMEKFRGEKAAKDHMAPFISFHLHEDPELEKIFYVAYAEWKQLGADLVNKAEAADKKKIENYEREKKESTEASE